MGEDGTAGGTYIGMIYENTSSITRRSAAVYRRFLKL
jgi:hypothetical protein